ncbi:IclR family transcriptional regulator [Haladaptatus halobius]|uniref:IclR family transcriptional regulator n=1 Tax=Haladaptatus halobius TaxID=2884875 RepID=UPI001D0B0944|nr:IclR family transcriptional regulator [Haladaptatus halobius]
MAKPEPKAGTGIEAVNKAIQIIELLKERNGAGVTELASQLDWPKSTVHAHLQTLKENEYVVYENDEYVLGFRFLELGEYVKHRKDVYALIEPKIEQLAEETGERVQFVVNEHGDGVYIRIAEGEQAVSTGSSLGRRRTMLHATAAGKAILAFLPEEQVYDIIERTGLPELTPNTITEESELLDALEEVRERGYAFNHEEHIEGLQAVAAPVEDSGGDVIGAISVSGPAHRVKGERMTEDIPDKILGVRNEVELDIIYR